MDQSDLTAELALITAKIALRFNIKFRTLSSLLKRSLICEAKQQYPNDANVQIAVRTGVDRRSVASHLEDEQCASVWHGKEMLVLRRLYEYCDQFKTSRIGKYSGGRSFREICAESANGSITPEAIGRELMRRGVLIDRGKYYEVVEPENSLKIQAEYTALNTFVKQLGQLVDELEPSDKSPR